MKLLNKTAHKNEYCQGPCKPGRGTATKKAFIAATGNRVAFREGLGIAAHDLVYGTGIVVHANAGEIRKRLARHYATHAASTVGSRPSIRLWTRLFDQPSPPSTARIRDNSSCFLLPCDKWSRDATKIYIESQHGS